MNRKVAMSLAFCLSAAGVQLAAAQSDTTRATRNEFAIAFGAALTQQRDATASPFQFDGTGYQIGARYGRTAGRTSLSATFDRGRRHLTTDAGSTDVEDLSDDELRLAFGWTPGTRPPTTSLTLGVDAVASRCATSHRYADPTRSVFDFLIGAVTIGPSVAWGHSVAGGLAIARLSVPFIGLVDHPYSDARNNGPVGDTRIATLAVLRGIATGVSFATAAERPIGIEGTYRFRAIRYADVQPMRGISQSLTVGVVTRFGARTPR